MLATSQYQYESTIAQAIARCRRFNQNKLVHVHHFAALGTIDVDILEKHQKRSDALKSTGCCALESLPRSDEKEKTRMIRSGDGIALVPVSCLEDERRRYMLGLGGKTDETFT